MKRPLVILHGWNLSAAKFIPLSRELKKLGYRIYVPDLPGFGKNQKVEKPLNLSDYAIFVEAYLKKHKISKAVIIGHSFGGRIALKMAAAKNGNLVALVLTGTPGFLPLPKIKVLFFMLLAKIGGLFFSLPIINRLDRIMRKILYRTAGASDFYHTKENMRQTFKNIVREELSPYLKKINTPTLLLWGRDDGIVPLSVAFRMSKTISRVQLQIINEAKHGVPWTHPEEFSRHLDRFLKKYA
ncbi:hypothetical protein A3J20_04380 [Candidatus Gottesmanbacteria bacterium RIFCSPLOWO2_02_FULL_42_29]|uniref:AB hydrolase-1 domain-containing protein n=1 Tax=Candidatus Gottesmanbacteria bacterium RIFCSPLOWO2_01_FULL_42_22 TaxID=1798391 RepID=A0A1F6BFY5_9BACT|nr:MAG: hypothetical protein A2781_01370 [Candidatus Gottesmanbacteria bacterium RIFCSPHIGHO2_01_FULL_42_27]OGG19364.1 MAG: hypothetical protein A3E72_02300 [Candidatus Gottesmanbacteria bacterium RIFCSPHIGHO2_12_FULL_43_26]OGG34270.1 MAG: hypothetical protein A3G68_05230 [Candidatus Gottesmanbacteria bacterium RIFCSPLOWO2_12_FULL_42_10]OGG35845.1 MAG: hypothetical protein A2968_06010 [Candidatus Gottesmanbacteria bacterium RIFCSPLOWO2_01_FULL_42_22]OGG38808.1 MAG: hypothetical protein A3J20_04